MLRICKFWPAFYNCNRDPFLVWQKPIFYVKVCMVTRTTRRQPRGLRAFWFSALSWARQVQMGSHPRPVARNVQAVIGTLYRAVSALHQNLETL
jgi:hypothetical protein